MKLKLTPEEAERQVIEDEGTSDKFDAWLQKNRDKVPDEWGYEDLYDFYEELGCEITDQDVVTWIYARTNAYDLVAKIENRIANVIADAADFPKLSGNAEDKNEDCQAIKEYMQKVIENSDPERWETHYAEDIIDGCDILFEKEIQKS